MSSGSGYDKKLVFVSSPALENDKGNIEDARQFCKYVFNCGAVPFAPQLFFSQVIFWLLTCAVRALHRTRQDPTAKFRAKRAITMFKDQSDDRRTALVGPKTHSEALLCAV